MPGSRDSAHRAATKFDRELGKLVRSRRLSIGVSQEALAEALGVTFQQVQKYEKGVNRIPASRLLDLSIALDVPIQYFFNGLPESVKQERKRAVGVVKKRRK